MPTHSAFGISWTKEVCICTSVLFLVQGCLRWCGTEIAEASDSGLFSGREVSILDQPGGTVSTGYQEETDRRALIPKDIRC